MKGIIIILSIIVCMAVSLQLHGQCYFENAYRPIPHTENYYGYSILQTDSHEIVTAGFKLDTSIQIYIFKTNACGDRIWSKSYQPSARISNTITIIEVKDGYALLGTHFDSLEMRNNCFLMKIDEDGNLIWFKDINLGVNDTGTDIISLGDEGFVFTGYYSTPSTYSFLAKTDTLGNVLWKTDFRTNSLRPEAKWLQKTSDNGYIVGGPVGNIVSHFMELFLFKADSLGNELWFNNYTYASQFYRGYGQAIATHDGGYMILSYEEALFEEINRYYLIKTDANGVVEWERPYGDGTSTYFVHQIGQTPEGNYIISGGKSEQVLGVDYGYQYLAKLSSQGDVMWERLRPDSLTGNIMTSMISNEGDLLFSGNWWLRDSISANKSSLYMLTTDSCGYTVRDSTHAFFEADNIGNKRIWIENQSNTVCSYIWHFGDGNTSNADSSFIYTYANSGSYTIMLITRAGNTIDTMTRTISVNGVGIEESETLQANLYPNPTNGTVAFRNLPEGAHLAIYSLQGHAIVFASAIGPIDVQALAPGMYLYTITDAQGQTLKVGKLVKD